MLAPFIVAALAFAACAAIGFDRFEDVLENGPESARDYALLVSGGVAILATLRLVLRSARPASRSPLDRADQPVTARPTTSTAPPSPALPRRPRSHEAVTRERAEKARTVRRMFFVMTTALTLFVAGSIAVKALNSREAIRSIDVPQPIAPERSCPDPAPGGDPLDDARTDCAPFADGVFETGPTVIQGVAYDGVERDETIDCAEVIELARLRDTCRRVARGSYLRADGATVRGFVAIVEFETRDEARRVYRSIDPEGLVFDPLAQRGVWAGPGKARSCSNRIGRYVTCVMAVPIGEATAGDALETAQHLQFLATDALVARRFATS